MLYKMNKARIPAYIVCQLFYNVFTVFFAWVIMQITDALVAGDKTIFAAYLGIAGAGIGFQVLFNFLSLRLQNKIISVSMSRIRSNSLYGILKTESRYMEEEIKSKYVSYFTSELELFENSYLRMCLNMINSVMLLALSGGMIFKIHKSMVLIIIIMMAVMVLIPFGLSNQLQKANSIYLDSNNNLIKNTEEYLNGFELIKTFFIENKIIKLYKNTVNKRADDKRKLENKMGVANAITGVMSVLIVLSTFIAGGFLILRSVLTIGALLAVVQLISNMIVPLTDILYGINEINSVKEIKDKVIKLLEKADENELEINSLPLGKRMEIQNLSFIYLGQEDYALREVNAILEKGKTYAVIGENGCGKSTFAKVIAGYYINYSGEISIDGKSIKTIPDYRIRDRIVYMNQKVLVFSASSRDNCTLFGEYELDSNVINALNCNEILESEISAGNMSGGEQQKISFIRCFSKNSDILICDEPDSAMDVLAKRQLIELLKEDNEKIKIIITHTIDESLSEYDTILYFKNGFLEEIGNFNDLYKEQGEFYKYFNRKIDFQA